MPSKKWSRRDFLRAGAIGSAGIAAATTGLSIAQAGAGLATPRRKVQGDVTITIVDPWAGTSFGDAHAAQQQRFMDSHPNIKIEHSTIPFSDFRTMLIQGA